MKLLKKLKNKPFCNDLHYFLFAIIILFLSIKYSLFYIVLFLYLVFIYKKTKYLFYILCILLSLIIELLLINLIDINKDSLITATILTVEEDGYIIKSNLVKIKIIDYKNVFKPGDKIECYLDYYNLEDKAYMQDFDYQEYLYSQGIKYQAKFKYVKLVNNGYSINNIKYLIRNYIGNLVSQDTLSYIDALVLADNNLSNELKDGYSSLGISHILAISGMHILMIYNLLKKIFFKVFKIYKEEIPLILLTIYTFIIGCPSSAFRATLFILLGYLNKGSIKYTKLDILSISCIIMIYINPYQIYSLGFILSYLVSFILIFDKEIIKGEKGLKNEYMRYLLIYFVTLPIVSSINPKISLLAFILSPILSILISKIIIPITFLILTLPPLDIIFKYVFIFLNQYILGLNNIELFITIPTFDIYLSIVYYLFLIYLIISIILNKNLFKPVISLIVFFLVITNFTYLIIYNRITYISVGQGDSTYIELSHNRGNMLIDTFNCDTYLSQRGVRKIDCLILTHSDNDHIKDCINIIKKYNVDTIYYPKYDKEFQTILKGYKSIGLSYENYIFLDDIYIDILSPITDLEETNSNSLSLRFSINNYSFIFCADITTKTEELLVNSNQFINSDFLKVAHHGSSTSCSDIFLKKVKPKYSIVSVGMNNNYNLPDYEIINKLKKISTVYQTSINGNIDVYIYKDELKIKTYR